MHPDEETLAGLALGDPATPDAVVHLHGCSECTAELEALQHLRALAREAEPDAGDIVPPPPGLWARIVAEIDEQGPTVVELSGARARREAGGREAARTAPRRAAEPPRRSAPWAVGAAAAGLLVGLGGGWALWGASAFAPAPAPAPVASRTVVASTPLDTLDTREQRGDAEVARRDDGLSLVVRTEPIEAGDGVLEVWLINRDLQRMVSVGILPVGAASETFAIEQRLLDEGYVIVDISREGLDNRPEHSGDSVVRGTLPV